MNIYIYMFLCKGRCGVPDAGGCQRRRSGNNPWCPKSRAHSPDGKNALANLQWVETRGQHQGPEFTLLQLSVTWTVARS